MIQSVDSEKSAYMIDKECKKRDKVMPVLIEVNIGKEPNKDGALPEQIEELAEIISKLKNVKLKGLMAMAPYSTDPEKYRPYFREMKKIYDKLKKEHQDIDTLSMGMSESYKIAVEEGANMIRLGTAIFGKRD
jgi:hypothetical protein